MSDTFPRWIGSKPTDRPQILFAGTAEHSAVALLLKVLETDFTLIHVTTGSHILDQSASLQPDLVLLDTALEDMTAANVCEALLAEHRVNSTTPVLFVAPAPPTFEQRLALVRAGARDTIGLWIAPEDVGRLCHAYVDAKRDVDRGTAESLFDPATGLYSWQGLVRRARELGALALRQRQGLACVVFAIDLPPNAATQLAAAAARSARGIQETVRLSDAVGRPGDAQFAVLAPATDASGAVGLATRLVRPTRAAAARGVGLDPDTVTVRAGYAAVANLAYKPIDPATLLLRAGMALFTGAPVPQHQWLRAFVEPPQP
jgi:PleD family two-component response regulator